MEDIIKKIKEKMKERNYYLLATNAQETILYFCIPFDEKPRFSCEVYIDKNEYVEFKFEYITKKLFILCSNNIGSFFDDEHFNKFESEFFVLANELFNLENKE